MEIDRLLLPLILIFIFCSGVIIGGILAKTPADIISPATTTMPSTLSSLHPDVVNAILNTQNYLKPPYAQSFNASQVAYTYDYNNNRTIIYLKGIHFVYFSNKKDWYTTSMNGTFGAGNVVIFSNDIGDLKVGDIISVRKNSSFGVTHRIVNITNDCIITKGDANNVVDGVCWKKEDVIFKILGAFYTYEK